MTDTKSPKPPDIESLKSEQLLPTTSKHVDLNVVNIPEETLEDYQLAEDYASLRERVMEMMGVRPESGVSLQPQPPVASPVIEQDPQTELLAPPTVKLSALIRGSIDSVINNELVSKIVEERKKQMESIKMNETIVETSKEGSQSGSKPETVSKAASSGPVSKLRKPVVTAPSRHASEKPNVDSASVNLSTQNSHGDTHKSEKDDKIDGKKPVWERLFAGANTNQPVKGGAAAKIAEKKAQAALAKGAVSPSKKEPSKKEFRVGYAKVPPKVDKQKISGSYSQLAQKNDSAKKLSSDLTKKSSDQNIEKKQNVDHVSQHVESSLIVSDLVTNEEAPSARSQSLPSHAPLQNNSQFDTPPTKASSKTSVFPQPSRENDTTLSYGWPTSGPAFYDQKPYPGLSDSQRQSSLPMKHTAKEEPAQHETPKESKNKAAMKPETKPTTFKKGAASNAKKHPNKDEVVSKKDKPVVEKTSKLPPIPKQTQLNATTTTQSTQQDVSSWQDQMTQYWASQPGSQSPQPFFNYPIFNPYATSPYGYHPEIMPQLAMSPFLPMPYSPMPFLGNMMYPYPNYPMWPQPAVNPNNALPGLTKKNSTKTKVASKQPSRFPPIRL